MSAGTEQRKLASIMFTDIGRPLCSVRSEQTLLLLCPPPGFRGNLPDFPMNPLW